MNTNSPHLVAAPPYRIDVHHHILPPFYLAALRQAGVSDPIPGIALPHWDVKTTLAMMDRQGIATAIISLSEPGVLCGDMELTRALARQMNEFSASLIADYPRRFGAFAVLPLPDVEAALRELEYALDTLKLDGVGLLTHYQGTYLGDHAFEEMFAELHRRGVIAFVHPSAPPAKDQPTFGLPTPLYEFAFDTTRTVANLLYSGTLDRYPDLKIILSHAGGAVPYLAKRLTYGPMIGAAVLKARAPQDVFTSLRRLYYDLAMSSSPIVLSTLHALIDPTHILFGSDYPFIPEQSGAEGRAELTGYQGFSERNLKQIECENALTLFSRFHS